MATAVAVSIGLALVMIVKVANGYPEGLAFVLWLVFSGAVFWLAAHYGE